MGSPAIAAPTLDLLAHDFDVRLVVTPPDRPSGRGLKLTPTAVHERAGELGLPVLTTGNVNSQECIARLKAAEPQVIVVVSFGQLLRKAVLALPPLGCINVHFSLLPELRGAAPVAWAIIRGMEETGVSIMKMVARMDAGPVLAQAREHIGPKDTTVTVGARLAPIGARLLVETLALYAGGRVTPAAQDEGGATSAPKITRETAAIDWARSAREVDCLTRGLSGQMEAYAYYEGPSRLRVTLYMSAVTDAASPGPGVAARGPHGELLIGCGTGMIEVIEIQVQGRRRVLGREFANGYHICGGERFSNGL
jgi:methionyl-tRNA formyltransferase